MSRLHVATPLILLAGAWGVPGCGALDGPATTDSLTERRAALRCATPVSRADRLDEGESMTSTVSYDAASGVANVSTTLINSRSVWGWTGAVMVAFVDENGAPLFLSEVQTHGIDACWFSCPRRSTVNWSTTVPAGLSDSVAGVAILHFLEQVTPDAQSIAANVVMFPICPSGGSSLVPIMTGPSTPSGTVSRSGVYSSSYEAWKAFDGNADSMWISQVLVTPAVIGYAWSNGPRTVRRYALSFANGSLTSRAPRDWTLEGWDGASWVVVDQRSGEVGWLGRDRREYDVAAPDSYSDYRFSFTDDNDARPGVVVISLGNIELFD